MTTSQNKVSEANSKPKPDCIIPAKKHSSRLPGKNKLEIGGKPMVMWTVEAAFDSGVFDTIWVSTDDEEILEMSYDFRLKHKNRKGVALVNPHKRPPALATSQVQIKELIRFFCVQFRMPPHLCVMVPCNPFRTAQDLKDGYELFLKRDANYVMSVAPAPKPPQWALRVNGGYLTPRTDLKQTQKSGRWWYHDGSFVFFKLRALAAEFAFDFHGTKCVPYYINHHSIDIDTRDEYEYAKYLFESGNLSGGGDANNG